jgi:hypothetical protein
MIPGMSISMQRRDRIRHAFRNVRRTNAAGATKGARKEFSAFTAAKAAADLRRLYGRLKLNIDVAKLRCDRR